MGRRARYPRFDGEVPVLLSIVVQPRELCYIKIIGVSINIILSNSRIKRERYLAACFWMEGVILLSLKSRETMKGGLRSRDTKSQNQKTSYKLEGTYKARWAALMIYLPLMLGGEAAVIVLVCSCACPGSMCSPRDHL